MATPLTLKVFKGDALVETKEFDRDILKIGRLASAHLVLDDEKVSRIHAVIDATEGRLSITDMGSMEGTFVNGKRVNKSSLALGDEIKLGGTRIVVEGRKAAEVAAPAPAQATTEQVAVPAAPPPVSAPALVVAAGIDGVVSVPPPAARPPSKPALTKPPPPAAGRPPESARAPSAKPLPKAAKPAAKPAVKQASTGARRGNPLKNLWAKPRRRESDLGSGEVGLQVRFVWGESVIAVHQFDKAKSLVVGSEPDCDFHLGDSVIGGPRFELVKQNGADFVVRVPSRAIGELDEGAGPVTLAQCKRLVDEGGAKSITLTTRDFLWVDLGGVRAEIGFAAMPRPVFVPLSESVDYRFANLLLLALFLAAGFVISAKNLPPDDDTLADDLLKRPAMVAKFLLKEEQRKKNPFLERLKSEKKNDGEAAAKAKKDEGKMGLKDMKSDTKQKSGVKAIDPNAKDRAKAMVANLFGNKSGGIQTIFGSGGLGGDLKSAVGNMFGNQVGNSGGLGGLGIKGAGMGGGGAGNTVGIGAIGTHGRGGGAGSYGNGVGNLTGKKEVDIGISNDNAVVVGSLDKELIRQVIHRNRQQIRYCYENQLTRFPKLEGKVAIKFVISAEGSVAMASVAQSTVNNAELESCLASRFKSWTFPKPKGGGIVQVTYPVVLKQSGE